MKEDEISFKPEFGNLKHIEALKIIARIEKNKEIRSIKIKESKGIAALDEKIKRDIQRVKYLLK